MNHFSFLFFRMFFFFFSSTVPLFSHLLHMRLPQIQAICNSFVPFQPYKLHRLDSGPATETKLTKDEATRLYTHMQTIRRLETSAGNLYKDKIVRGFCHLYSGQEACAVGKWSGYVSGVSFKYWLVCIWWACLALTYFSIFVHGKLLREKLKCHGSAHYSALQELCALISPPENTWEINIFSI